MRKLLIAGAAAALLVGAVAVSAQTPSAPQSGVDTKAQSTKAQSTTAQGEGKGHSSANQPRDAKGRFMKKDQAAGGSDGKAETTKAQSATGSKAGAEPRDEKGRFIKKDQAGSAAATSNGKAGIDTKDRDRIKKLIKRGGEAVGASPRP